MARGQGEVREARQAGLETGHDVVVSGAEREPQVRTHGDGHAHVRASRDRNRRADGDDVELRPALECPASGEQVARASRGSEDRHGVAEPAERFGRPGDVCVDLVGLGPGEGRDEADPKAHGRRV